MESCSRWKWGLTTRMKCSLKLRQRSAFLSGDAGLVQRNRFSQWLETAMEKGARVAHRWTTQSITSAHPIHYRNSLTPQQNMQARMEEWSARWNRDTEADAISQTEAEPGALMVGLLERHASGGRVSCTLHPDLRQRCARAGPAKWIGRQAHHAHWMLVRNLHEWLPERKRS